MNDAVKVTEKAAIEAGWQPEMIKLAHIRSYARITAYVLKRFHVIECNQDLIDDVAEDLYKEIFQLDKD